MIVWLRSRLHLVSAGSSDVEVGLGRRAVRRAPARRGRGRIRRSDSASRRTRMPPCPCDVSRIRPTVPKPRSYALASPPICGAGVASTPSPIAANICLDQSRSACFTIASALSLPSSARSARSTGTRTCAWIRVLSRNDKIESPCSRRAHRSCDPPLAWQIASVPPSADLRQCGERLLRLDSPRPAAAPCWCRPRS